MASGEQLGAVEDWFGFAELSDDTKVVHDPSHQTSTSSQPTLLPGQPRNPLNQPSQSLSENESKDIKDENKVVVPIISNKAGKTKYKVLARQKVEDDEEVKNKDSVAVYPKTTYYVKNNYWKGHQNVIKNIKPQTTGPVRYISDVLKAEREKKQKKAEALEAEKAKKQKITEELEAVKAKKKKVSEELDAEKAKKQKVSDALIAGKSESSDLLCDSLIQSDTDLVKDTDSKQAIHKNGKESVKNKKQSDENCKSEKKRKKMSSDKKDLKKKNKGSDKNGKDLKKTNSDEFDGYFKRKKKSSDKKLMTNSDIEKKKGKTKATENDNKPKRSKGKEKKVLKSEEKAKEDSDDKIESVQSNVVLKGKENVSAPVSDILHCDTNILPCETSMDTLQCDSDTKACDSSMEIDLPKSATCTALCDTSQDMDIDINDNTCIEPVVKTKTDLKVCDANIELNLKGTEDRPNIVTDAKEITNVNCSSMLPVSQATLCSTDTLDCISPNKETMYQDPSIENLQTCESSNYYEKGETDNVHSSEADNKSENQQESESLSENDGQIQRRHSSDLKSLQDKPVHRQTSLDDSKLKGIPMVYNPEHVGLRKSGRLKNAKCSSRYRGDYGIRAETYTKLLHSSSKSTVDSATSDDDKVENNTSTESLPEDNEVNYNERSVSSGDSVSKRKKSVSDETVSIHKKVKQDIDTDRMSGVEDSGISDVSEHTSESSNVNLECEETTQHMNLQLSCNKYRTESDVQPSTSGTDNILTNDTNTVNSGHCFKCCEVRSGRALHNTTVEQDIRPDYNDRISAIMSCEYCQSSVERYSQHSEKHVCDNLEQVPCSSEKLCTCDAPSTGFNHSHTVLVGHKMVLSAYENHRHLEPSSCAQPIRSQLHIVVPKCYNCTTCLPLQTDKTSGVLLRSCHNSEYVHSVGKSVNKKQNQISERKNKQSDVNTVESVVTNSSPESSPMKGDPVDILEDLRLKLFEQAGAAVKNDLTPKQFDSQLISSKRKESQKFKAPGSTLDELLEKGEVECKSGRSSPKSKVLKCSNDSKIEILQEVAQSLDIIQQAKRKAQQQNEKIKPKRQRFAQKKFMLRSMVHKNDTQSLHADDCNPNVLTHEDNSGNKPDTYACSMQFENDASNNATKQEKDNDAANSDENQLTEVSTHSEQKVILSDKQQGEREEKLVNKEKDNPDDNCDTKVTIKPKPKPKVIKCQACNHTFRNKDLMRKHYPCRIRQTRTWSQNVLRPKRALRRPDKKDDKFKCSLPKNMKKDGKNRLHLLTSRKTKFRRVKGKRRRRLYQLIQDLREKRKIVNWPHLSVSYDNMNFKEQCMYKLGLFCTGTPSEGFDNYTHIEQAWFDKHRKRQKMSDLETVNLTYLDVEAAESSFYDNLATKVQTSSNDELSTKEQTSSYDELSSKEQTASNDELSTKKETSSYDEMSNNEQTSSNDELSSKEQTSSYDKLSSKEQAPFDDELVYKEQTSSNDELSTKKQTSSYDEPSSKEQALSNDELSSKEQTSSYDKLSSNEQAPFDDELASKEQTSSYEEMSTKEQTLSCDEESTKEQAPFNDELLSKEQTILKDELLNKEQTSSKSEIHLSEKKVSDSTLKTNDEQLQVVKLATETNIILPLGSIIEVSETYNKSETILNNQIKENEMIGEMLSLDRNVFDRKQNTNTVLLQSSFNNKGLSSADKNSTLFEKKHAEISKPEKALALELPLKSYATSNFSGTMPQHIYKESEYNQGAVLHTDVSEELASETSVILGLNLGMPEMRDQTASTIYHDISDIIDSMIDQVFTCSTAKQETKGTPFSDQMSTEFFTQEKNKELYTASHLGSEHVEILSNEEFIACDKQDALDKKTLSNSCENLLIDNVPCSPTITKEKYITRNIGDNLPNSPDMVFCSDLITEGNGLSEATQDSVGCSPKTTEENNSSNIKGGNEFCSTENKENNSVKIVTEENMLCLPENNMAPNNVTKDKENNTAANNLTKITREEIFYSPGIIEEIGVEKTLEDDTIGSPYSTEKNNITKISKDNVLPLVDIIVDSSVTKISEHDIVCSADITVETEICEGENVLCSPCIKEESNVTENIKDYNAKQEQNAFKVEESKIKETQLDEPVNMLDAISSESRENGICNSVLKETSESFTKVPQETKDEEAHISTSEYNSLSNNTFVDNRMILLTDEKVLSPIGLNLESKFNIKAALDLEKSQLSIDIKENSTDSATQEFYVSGIETVSTETLNAINQDAEPSSCENKDKEKCKEIEDIHDCDTELLDHKEVPNDTFSHLNNQNSIVGSIGCQVVEDDNEIEGISDQHVFETNGLQIKEAVVENCDIDYFDVVEEVVIDDTVETPYEITHEIIENFPLSISEPEEIQSVNEEINSKFANDKNACEESSDTATSINEVMKESKNEDEQVNDSEQLQSNSSHNFEHMISKKYISACSNLETNDVANCCGKRLDTTEVKQAKLVEAHEDGKFLEQSKCQGHFGNEENIDLKRKLKQENKTEVCASKELVCAESEIFIIAPHTQDDKQSSSQESNFYFKSSTSYDLNDSKEEKGFDADIESTVEEENDECGRSESTETKGGKYGNSKVMNASNKESDVVKEKYSPVLHKVSENIEEGTLPRVECNEVLSAYENHRHLEPYPTHSLIQKNAKEDVGKKFERESEDEATVCYEVDGVMISENLVTGVKSVVRNKVVCPPSVTSGEDSSSQVSLESKKLVSSDESELNTSSNSASFINEEESFQTLLNNSHELSAEISDDDICGEICDGIGEKEIDNKQNEYSDNKSVIQYERNGILISENLLTGEKIVIEGKKATKLVIKEMPEIESSIETCEEELVGPECSSSKISEQVHSDQSFNVDEGKKKCTAFNEEVYQKNILATDEGVSGSLSEVHPNKNSTESTFEHRNENNAKQLIGNNSKSSTVSLDVHSDIKRTDQISSVLKENTEFTNVSESELNVCVNNARSNKEKDEELKDELPQKSYDESELQQQYASGTEAVSSDEENCELRATKPENDLYMQYKQKISNESLSLQKEILRCSPVVVLERIENMDLKNISIVDMPKYDLDHSSDCESVESFELKPLCPTEFNTQICDSEVPPILEKVGEECYEEMYTSIDASEDSQLSGYEPPTLFPEKEASASLQIAGILKDSSKDSLEIKTDTDEKKPRSERHFLDVLGDVEAKDCSLGNSQNSEEIHADAQNTLPKDEELIGRHFSDIVDTSMNADKSKKSQHIYTNRSPEIRDLTIAEVRKILKPKNENLFSKESLLKLRSDVASLLKNVKKPEKKDPAWLKRDSLTAYRRKKPREKLHENTSNKFTFSDTDPSTDNQEQSESNEELTDYDSESSEWEYKTFDENKQTLAVKEVEKIEGHTKTDDNSNITKGGITENILQMLTSFEDKGNVALNMSNLLEVLAKNLGFSTQSEDMALSSTRPIFSDSDSDYSDYEAEPKETTSAIQQHYQLNEFDEESEPPCLDDVPLPPDNEEEDKHIQKWPSPESDRIDHSKTLGQKSSCQYNEHVTAFKENTEARDTKENDFDLLEIQNTDMQCNFHEDSNSFLVIDSTECSIDKDSPTSQEFNCEKTLDPIESVIAHDLISPDTSTLQPVSDHDFNTKEIDKPLILSSPEHDYNLYDMNKEDMPAIGNEGVKLTENDQCNLRITHIEKERSKDLTVKQSNDSTIFKSITELNSILTDSDDSNAASTYDAVSLSQRMSELKALSDNNNSDVDSDISDFSDNENSNDLRHEISTPEEIHKDVITLYIDIDKEIIPTGINPTDCQKNAPLNNVDDTIKSEKDSMDFQPHIEMQSLDNLDSINLLTNGKKLDQTDEEKSNVCITGDSNQVKEADHEHIERHLGHVLIENIEESGKESQLTNNTDDNIVYQETDISEIPTEEKTRSEILNNQYDKDRHSDLVSHITNEQYDIIDYIDPSTQDNSECIENSEDIQTCKTDSPQISCKESISSPECEVEICKEKQFLKWEVKDDGENIENELISGVEMDNTFVACNKPDVVQSEGDDENRKYSVDESIICNLHNTKDSVNDQKTVQVEKGGHNVEKVTLVGSDLSAKSLEDNVSKESNSPLYSNIKDGNQELVEKNTASFDIKRFEGNFAEINIDEAERLSADEASIQSDDICSAEDDYRTEVCESPGKEDKGRGVLDGEEYTIEVNEDTDEDIDDEKKLQLEKEPMISNGIEGNSPELCQELVNEDQTIVENKEVNNTQTQESETNWKTKFESIPETDKGSCTEEVSMVFKSNGKKILAMEDEVESENLSCILEDPVIETECVTIETEPSDNVCEGEMQTEMLSKDCPLSEHLKNDYTSSHSETNYIDFNNSMESTHCIKDCHEESNSEPSKETLISATTCGVISEKENVPLQECQDTLQQELFESDYQDMFFETIAEKVKRKQRERLQKQSLNVPYQAASLTRKNPTVKEISIFRSSMLDRRIRQNSLSSMNIKVPSKQSRDRSNSVPKEMKMSSILRGNFKLKPCSVKLNKLKPSTIQRYCGRGICKSPARSIDRPPIKLRIKLSDIIMPCSPYSTFTESSTDDEFDDQLYCSPAQQGEEKTTEQNVGGYSSIAAEKSPRAKSVDSISPRLTPLRINMKQLMMSKSKSFDFKCDSQPISNINVNKALATQICCKDLQLSESDSDDDRYSENSSKPNPEIIELSLNNECKDNTSKSIPNIMKKIDEKHATSLDSDQLSSENSNSETVINSINPYTESANKHERNLTSFASWTKITFQKEDECEDETSDKLIADNDNDDELNKILQVADTIHSFSSISQLSTDIEETTIPIANDVGSMLVQHQTNIDCYRNTIQVQGDSLERNVDMTSKSCISRFTDICSNSISLPENQVNSDKYIETESAALCLENEKFDNNIQSDMLESRVYKFAHEIANVEAYEAVQALETAEFNEIAATAEVIIDIDRDIHDSRSIDIVDANSVNQTVISSEEIIDYRPNKYVYGVKEESQSSADIFEEQVIEEEVTQLSRNDSEVCVPSLEAQVISSAQISVNSDQSHLVYPSKSVF